MNKIVLLVDDNLMDRKLLIKHLEKMGLNIISLPDAPKALEMLGVIHVDLIITDWLMPDMDGETFVKEVRKKDKEKPIIVYTSFRQPEDKGFILACGANDYIEKSYNFEEIQSKIKPWLS